MRVPDGLDEIIEMYGNPTKNGRLNPEWERENIVRLQIPWPNPYHKLRIAWDTTAAVYSMRVHKHAAEDLEKIFKKIWATARITVKQEHGFNLGTEAYDRMTIDLIRKQRLDLYGGAFNYRLKRGGNSLSVHSWGVAIDIDPDNNGMGDVTPSMPLWVVEIFEDAGWVWGGRWSGSRCDGMHFQRCTGY